MLPNKDFDIFHEKNHFSFFKCLKQHFCEAGTEKVVQNGTDTFSSHSRHHFMYNHQKACISELSPYLRQFKRLPADPVGNGQILNCSCHTACPLFFLNFIFRFTSIHFIIDTSKYPHDSNTRHERSRPRIRLDFQMSTRNSKKIKIMENLRIASSYVTQL